MHRLRIILRNAIKNRVYTLINVLGLMLGTTIAILAFLVIRYDLDFDRFHSKADRIYRVVHTVFTEGHDDYKANIPYPAGKDLSQEINGYEKLTEIHWDSEVMIEVNGQRTFEQSVVFADTNFFDVFDYTLISGNPQESLSKPNVVFLTASVAAKLFGKSDPIGERLKLGNRLDLEVVGLVEDPPASTHLPFTMIVSFPSLTSEYMFGFDITSWGTSLSGYLYVLLPENGNTSSVAEQINAFVSREREDTDWKTEYGLQPLTDIHFDTRYARFEFVRTVNTSYLFILGAIGLFIVLIASINFINLTTALGMKRSKEVGIKKALGARPRHLITGFLLETMLVTLLAVLLSMGIVERLLPMIGNFLDRNLDFNPMSNPTLLLYILLLVVGITLIAGLYPAFVLSSFNPLKALRFKFNSSRSSSISLRRTLVIFQFVISQMLVIGCLVIIQQLNYMQSKPLGFDREALLLIDVFERDQEKLKTLQERLLQYPGIVNVSFATGAPTSFNSIGTSLQRSDWEEGRYIRSRIKAADSRYRDTYNLTMIAGEWYHANATPEQGMVINETAARELGFDTPAAALGTFVKLGVEGYEGPVVGIVQDFHSKSLQEEIGPITLFPSMHFFYETGIKIETGNAQETIAYIVEQHEALFPGFIYAPIFMDDMLNDLYEEEQRMFTMANVAGIFSILIGCMGLYGLISFIVIQKNKEVGIRKAIGASMSHIMINFTREFVLLLTVAFILAIPLIWYIMDQWLLSFAYHISISPWVFLLGYAGSLIIAVGTVGYKSYQAARVNPVDVLKED